MVGAARSRRALLAAILLVAASIVAACSSAAPPFDPSTPCTPDSGEGSAAGAYPDLESTLPTAYEGSAPTTVSSGRICTTASLGTLVDKGIKQVRFAGATWDLGGGKGLTKALFEADGLDTSTLATFYEQGARQASRTQAVQPSDVTVGSAAAKRLDVVYGDSEQTIVIWPAGQNRVHALLAADIGDTKVAEALKLFGS